MPHAPLPVPHLDRKNGGYASATQVVECYPKSALTTMCKRLLTQAREHVFLSNGALIPSTLAELEVFQRTMHAVLDRKVHLSLLHDLESLDTDNRRNLLRELSERGADIRISPYTPNCTLIIDKMAAVACNNSVRDHQVCAPIRSRTVIGSLQKLADITWRTSWELDLVSMLERRDSELSLEVLRLLSAGYKDEVGARLLGMSLRTYRRHVADLIKMLQARSRFEAGARAASLGLV